MEGSRHIRVASLSFVHEADAPAHVRRRPLVRHALPHHERGWNSERLEILLQIRDAIARRLQRSRDGSVKRREVLALLLRAIGYGNRENRPQPGRYLDDSLRGGA